MAEAAKQEGWLPRSTPNSSDVPDIVPSIPPEALQQRQLDMALESPLPALANLIIYLLIALIGVGELPSSELLAGIAVIVAASVCRIGLGGYRARVGSARFPARMWGNALTACVLLQGLSWSALSLAILPYAEDHTLILASSVGICGMLAGAIFTLAPYPPAFNTYALSISIGLILTSFLEGPQGSLVLTAMYAIYLAIVLTWGRTQARRNLRNLRLTMENEALRQMLEEARKDAALANALKQESFAALGHELRTPLNAIIGFAQSLEAQIWGPLGNDRYRDYAQTINNSAQHLYVLIQDVLDLARHDAGKIVLHEQPVDLTKMLSACRQMLAGSAGSAGVYLALLPTDQPAWVSGDPTKLRQVVINLAANAIRHTPQSGVVQLSVTRLPDRSTVLSISDTGVGIAPENLERVLEPFVQLENPTVKNQGGAGLGLPLAKRIAEMHGGSLALESEVNKGTTARVILPPARTIDPPPAT